MKDVRLADLVQTIENLNKKHKLEIENLTKESATRQVEAIKKSRQVNKGLEIEVLAPILSAFNTKDLFFLGNPIDYVCFDGLEDVINGKQEKLNGIYFLEIKSGKSRLNKNQRKIRDWLKTNTAQFQLLRISDTGNIK